MRGTSPLYLDQSTDGVPVAGEARLISHIETLAEQTHPLDGPRGLQLSQPTMTRFTLIHLECTRTNRKLLLQQHVYGFVSINKTQQIQCFLTS